MLLEMKCVFKHQDLQMLGLKLDKINMGNFHPLEVVGHSSPPACLPAWLPVCLLKQIPTSNDEKYFYLLKIYIF